MKDNEVYKIKITADITVTKEKANTDESDDWQWPEPKYDSTTYKLVDEPAEFDNTHPYILLVKKLKAGTITREEFDTLINRIDCE